MTNPLLAVLILVTIYECHSNQQVKRDSNQSDQNEWILFNGKILDNWEIIDFSLQSSIHIEKDSIIFKRSNATRGIKWLRDIPAINYEVTLEVMRMEGIDLFCGLTFPIYEDVMTLVIGDYGGSVVGLSCIDGVYALNNETCIMRSFQDNHWYHIRLRVTDKAVLAWIDGKEMVHFLLEDHELSLLSKFAFFYPFGIACGRTKTALRNIQVRTISPEF